MVEEYMQFNVFINMTCMSLTPSLNDNQRVIMEKGGSNQFSSVEETVDKSSYQNVFFEWDVLRIKKGLKGCRKHHTGVSEQKHFWDNVTAIVS